MQFLKKFFNHDDIFVGLSRLRKQERSVKITVPSYYKKKYIQNVEFNSLLFWLNIIKNFDFCSDMCYCRFEETCL